MNYLYNLPRRAGLTSLSKRSTPGKRRIDKWVRTGDSRISDDDFLDFNIVLRPDNVYEAVIVEESSPINMSAWLALKPSRGTNR
jgi:hypothetical protein